jgi:hypothetical protein
MIFSVLYLKERMEFGDEQWFGINDKISIISNYLRKWNFRNESRRERKDARTLKINLKRWG